MAHCPRFLLPLMLSALLFVPRAHAQSDDVELDDRIVAASISALSFGLGTLAVSLRAADGDEGWNAVAVGVTVAAAAGAATLACLVPSNEDGAMLITFPTVIGGAAMMMVGWVAMSGTMSDDEVIAGVATPLLLGPVLGIALAALFGALDEPDDTSLRAAADFAPRVVVPISGSF